MLFAYIIISLLICVLIFFVSKYFLKGRELMKKLTDFESNYRELADQHESVNQILENRIKEEVEKNRQNEMLLIQHSRLAAMGEMIASLSHEWRQPLNHLSLIIQDVAEAHELGEIDDKYMERFTEESMGQINLMSRLIHDFRKFYRPNKEKCPFSIGDSIDEALYLFSSSLKNHGIQIDFEYRGQQIAYGYPNDFSQVVLNILINARDAFVAKDRLNRKITISLTESPQFITAEFTDNAGGIEPSISKQLFDPFFTTRPHGTGLGLYMSKLILENMDGAIHAENIEEGARFSLSVPKVAAPLKTLTAAHV